ncbi:MAG TPA: ferredoxin [Coriobacteriia bacterium]|nr:ferredoxin [Coriobacteriia bacterium]
MKPIVDHDLCIGCGMCEDTCPEVFQLRDDGFSYVIAEDPPPELYGAIRDAVDLCPVQAISIEGV